MKIGLLIIVSLNRNKILTSNVFAKIHLLYNNLYKMVNGIPILISFIGIIFIYSIYNPLLNTPSLDKKLMFD